MGDVQPFAITTSEDLQIHGVVTFPKSDESNQPMVVIPHGGPIGARDSIAFNREAQFFAHHGYVVMQVNFRGSGGYGYDFQRKGYEQWGSGMIDDISLAVTWAIQNGLADRDSICILGGSYGAFAAISSVVQEPQKYQCAIGYSGVYDLTMLDESDIPWNPGGGAYLDEALGTNEEELTRQSPVNFTDNIEVPIFLAHGGEDARAPIEQANQLREALDESGVEYEWLYKRNEGHGFYQEENRVEFYDAVLAFLERHIN
jgi:dipeptidyl aminopeptidase/acylaminoacyl peptidase